MAVCAPNSRRDDKSRVENNVVQQELWLAWKDAWLTVKKKANKRPIVIIFGGEIAEINWKHPSNQFITNTPSLVISNAMKLIEAPLEMASKTIFIRGTEAHTGLNGDLDEQIAQLVNSEYGNVVMDEDLCSWYSHEFFIGGRKFDIAHHVSMGGMPWTEKNAANALSAKLIMEYSERRKPFPDFAFRGHVHRFSDSADNYTIHSAITGCWTFQNSFSHRIGAGSKQPQIGLLFCDPAARTVEKIKYEPKEEDPIFI